jgi:hypothetical protein
MGAPKGQGVGDVSEEGGQFRCVLCVAWRLRCVSGPLLSARASARSRTFHRPEMHHAISVAGRETLAIGDQSSAVTGALCPP